MASPREEMLHQYGVTWQVDESRSRNFECWMSLKQAEDLAQKIRNSCRCLKIIPVEQPVIFKMLRDDEE